MLKCLDSSVTYTYTKSSPDGRISYVIDAILEFVRIENLILFITKCCFCHVSHVMKQDLRQMKKKIKNENKWKKGVRWRK